MSHAEKCPVCGRNPEPPSLVRTGTFFCTAGNENREIWLESINVASDSEALKRWKVAIDAANPIRREGDPQ